MRAYVHLFVVLAACGAPALEVDVPTPLEALAPAPSPPHVRLVFAIDGPGEGVEAYVRTRLSGQGIEPMSVSSERGELVVAVDPAIVDAAQSALVQTTEFFIAEVDEQWTASELGVPAWARVDERTSWAGDPRPLRTVVVQPEDHDRLSRALGALRSRPARRFFVGKNLLTRDQPDGAHGVLVQEAALAAGPDIREVEVAEEGAGLTVVYVTFDEDATAALRDATTGRSGFRIALVLDGRVLMAPVITAPIEDGRARIDPGDGDASSAERLAVELRRSAQPARLRLLRREDPR